MSVLQEFKTFAMKGNVMDLAVGVIIGGAFGKIVESVVGDLIMPLIAWVMGGKLDFSGMFNRITFSTFLGESDRRQVSLLKPSGAN